MDCLLFFFNVFISFIYYFVTIINCESIWYSCNFDVSWLINIEILPSKMSFVHIKKGERNGEEFNFEFCVDQTLDEGSSLNGEGGRESGRDLLRRRRRMGVTCRVGDTCRGANMQVAFSSGYGIEVKEAGC